MCSSEGPEEMSNEQMYPPPSSSSSSSCDEQSCLDSDDRRTAIEEIAREQSLVAQLRAVVLPAIRADGRRHEAAVRLFESILEYSSKAMTELMSQSDGEAEEKSKLKGQKRRRVDGSLSLATHVPHYDGHQWRKYGQKQINNAKHPRSYYRCIYKQGQKCMATKTVQQQDDGATADPARFTVVYYGQHTCTDGDGGGAPPRIVETAPRSSSQSSDEVVSPAVSMQPPEMQELIDKIACMPLDSDFWAMDLPYYF